MKFASMFTGGGLADQGARMAGLTPVWGVEYDPAIAAVAQQNDPTGTIHVASVCDVDYAALPRVDVLHASPPCPNFSVAKTDRGETALDLELADAVVRAIRAQAPRLFTLENVRGYANSKSLQRIQAALLELDYHVTTVIANAADYGVAQTRERLFLIAHAGGWMQPARPLPAAQPWRGWYSAIEDLIPTLPDSQFAPWQLARLPEVVSGSTLVDGTEMRENGLQRSASEPANTVKAASYKGLPRAFIVEGQPGLNGTYMNVRQAAEPFWTVAASIDRKPARAFLVNGDNATRDLSIRTEIEPALTVSAQRPGGSQARAWLNTGRVVAMTPRALGRFQSLPDTYVLPDKAALACKIIGNGVACETYAAIVRSQA